VVFDHTSILKLIEWRWGLRPLTARDASDQIGNPAAIMNFQSPDSSIPALPDAIPFPARPCFEGGIFSLEASKGGGAEPSKAPPRTSPWAALASIPAVNEFASRY
jgi:phospholipase C